MKTTIRSKFASAALASAMGLAAVAGFATPAQAAETTATFTLTAGALQITVPAAAELTGGSPDSAASAQLGTTTVTDERGALLGDWTAEVSSSDFTTGTETADETIAMADADYWSGLATASSGDAVFLPGQADALAKETMAASRTAFSASAIVGNNSASWNPTFIVNVPATAVAGTYTGTVTHSVA